MNEVTKIHLGRQAFAISADAHRELKNYLDAIRRHVNDDEVADEVESRMAELLEERGVHGEQVILPADVDYLREQLGDPKDFAEDDGEQPGERSADTKRLFRDTDNAMLAGVAAGLANYFGVDVLIVRLLFVIAVFTGGWGILIYVVLWLLVPEAKTSAERLQMAGKPVTIEGLKEIVERADVKGAAERANKSLAGPVNALLHIILKVIGICFVVIGLSLLLSLVGGATYALLRGSTALYSSIFPIGIKEHLLVYVGAAVAAVISLFVVLFGMALYRRRWPIHTWITGVLLGLLCIGIAVGGALTADIVPQVRDRYNANMHTTVRMVQPFTSVDTDAVDSDIAVVYGSAPNYSVSLRYFGHPDLNTIKTTVSNGVLTVDTSGFNWRRDCHDELCIPNDYELTITINSAATSAPAPSVPAPVTPAPSIVPLKN